MKGKERREARRTYAESAGVCPVYRGLACYTGRSFIHRFGIEARIGRRRCGPVSPSPPPPLAAAALDETRLVSLT